MNGPIPVFNARAIVGAFKHDMSLRMRCWVRGSLRQGACRSHLRSYCTSAVKHTQRSAPLPVKTEARLEAVFLASSVAIASLSGMHRCVIVSLLYYTITIYIPVMDSDAELSKLWKATQKNVFGSVYNTSILSKREC